MQNNDSNENNGQKWIDVPHFVNNSSDLNQVSGKIKKRVEDFDDSSDFVREVNSSLAKQVRSDLDGSTPSRSSNNNSNRGRKKKKKGKALKVTFAILLTLTAICCLLVFTPPGRKLILDVAGNYIYGNLDHDATQASSSKPVFQDDVVNILLIGVEEIGGAKNTDSMIVATMNTKNHSLKLTSLMRDTYVQIKGYDNNKLNSVYAKGKIDLLYDTIETNFGIKLDGYCMVNFKAFEQLVDYVGGVKVTLTQKEADYLNSTNYISNRENRKVVAGTQTLNGNQALGYCRVRKRATSTEHDDFGRTQRQRIVIKGIYDKVKRKNPIELVLLMDKVLKHVKVETDISNDAFNRYLNEAANLKVKDLKTLRIPTNNSYENVKVPMGKYNVEVLDIKDWDATRKEIHDFIYGDSNGSQTDLDTRTATGASPTPEPTPTSDSE